MPVITPNPITVIPAKTSGGSVKNPANLIAYSAASQGPQAELWANVVKSLRDLQSQMDGVANSLRAPLGLPDPIQVVDAAGNLVASIGQYISPLTNSSFTGIWAKNSSFATDADPLGNGAKGDGVTDDTNALQKTINNSGGVLYLKPNFNFLCSSTLTAPNPTDVVYIYGGGRITSNATPIISIPHGNWLVEDIIIVGSAASGQTAVSVVSNSSQQATIRKCYIAASTGGSVGLALNASGNGIVVDGCFFVNWATCIALTSQSDTMISNCDFFNNTPVTTSGTCTYNLRNCNPATLDVYPSAQTSTTATAGGGQAVPATVLTYIEVNVVIAGVLTTGKMPIFSV